MNQINGTLIDLLLSAADTLRNETCRILQKYRDERNAEKKISERYKEEKAYYQSKQEKLAAIARAEIEKAERIFCNKVNDLAGQMEQQLKKHLSEPVNGQFREKLSMFADFGIQPERIEIDDLLSLNAGNQLGLTALAKTLEKVDSPYVLKYHSTADYQNDIAKVRNLTVNLKFIPLDYHSEGCEIYKGITADKILPNGQIIGNGLHFDSVSLLQNAAFFDSAIESIKDLKNVWSADCSYEDNPEKSEAMQYARQMGRETAKANNTLESLKAATKML